MTRKSSGSILTPDGWISGRISYDSRIVAIEGDPIPVPAPPYILPGFIDLHVHGGGGSDIMEGEAAIRQAARLHARHGTTSMLATTITAPADETVAAVQAAGAVVADPQADEARLLGVHLEGPFINPGRLGAQPAFAVPPDLALLARLGECAPVRVITIAPECDPDGALADAVRAAGIRAQIGHTLCDYACARAHLLAGWGVTHLYNAMSPFSQRASSLIGAALAHADYAEIIPDLIHVDAGGVLAAHRAIPNLYGVTDATAGAGMPDGEYRLGSHRVTKRDGAMRLADGTLAGSSLTMDQALRNLVGLGLALADAARRLSTIPADWLGETDLGRLSVGAHADIIELDGDLTLTGVSLAGRPHGAPTSAN